MKLTLWKQQMLKMTKCCKKCLPRWNLDPIYENGYQPYGCRMTWLDLFYGDANLTRVRDVLE